MCKKGISRKRLLLILCPFLAPLLTGFELLGFAYHSWHQKMSVEVEVEVGDQVYTGWSMVEMNVMGHPEIPMVNGVRNLELEGKPWWWS